MLALCSDRDPSFEVGRGRAGHFDPIALDLAKELAAARRDLAGVELRATEPFGPERNKGGMRRARHRVLVNARRWREEARDEVAVLAGRRHDNSEAAEGAERGEIGCEGAHLRLSAEHGDRVARLEELARRGAKRL